MQRNDFGSWGAELSGSEFARALAALGVLQARRPFVLDRPESLLPALQDAIAASNREPTPWGLSWRPMAGDVLPVPSAAGLAEAWRQVTAESSPGVRLEIDALSPLYVGFDPPSTLPWIAEQLSRAAVGARSVYVRADLPEGDAGWQWPLRVGLLREGRSATLRAQLAPYMEGHPWLPRLVSLVEVGEEGGDCDILLLPMDLRAALAAISALPRPPRADCVIVLGRTQGSPGQWYRLVEGVRAAAVTLGVAVTHVPAESHVDWFMEFVRELSHNHPLDVALFAVRAKGSAPFIAAARRLVDFSSLASQLRRMASRFEGPRLAPFAISSDLAPSAEPLLGGGKRSLGDIARDLREIAGHADRDPDFDGFLQESGMASVAADLSAAANVVAAEVSPGPPEPRFIQAQVFEPTAPGSEWTEDRPTRSWRAGVTHRIVVRIGTAGEGWISAPDDTPFPAERLPPDQDDHELTVVITEPQLLEEPQLATIILPRRGDSTEARFHLFVREGVEEVRARIIVSYRNRVLQTAILHGRVGAGEEDQSDGAISVYIEAVVRADLTDLDRRRDFDAALVLNHSATGTAGITTLTEGEARAFHVAPTLSKEIDWFDARLSEIAVDRSLFAGGLEADATVDLLRSFARHGEILYKHIVRSGIRCGDLTRGGRIQIVSAVAGARLPAEFIYDRRAPNDTATLCPNAAAILRRGECAADCPGQQSARDYICPLGFWGLSWIIERHSEESRLSRPELAELVESKPHALRVEPVEGRDVLPVLRGGLVAGSQRVENTVPGGLREICERITDGQPGLDPVETWEAWTSKIGGEGPSLLVLLVHTELSSDQLEQMEIGAGSWLCVVDMDEEHIARDRKSPPIVLLLGCETGAPEVEFAGFVSRCLEYGAAVVVATGARIHSVHAVPVAKAFVDAMRTSLADGATTFGEVMRTVRRAMLADGLPMVLTLTAYGDADWRLVPHDA